MGDDSDEDGDVNMNRSYADIEDEEDRLARIKREESENADITNNGLDQEATLEKGVGAALKLLKDRGIIKTNRSGLTILSMPDLREMVSHLQADE